MRTKGAGDAMDRLEMEIKYLREAANLCWDNPHDPLYVRDRIEEVKTSMARMARIIRDEIDPLLARKDPKTNDRLDEMERRIEALEGTNRVTAFRREA